MDGVQFVKSAVRANQYPKHHEPEIALVGRSNVGKSSFINALAGRRKEAKVSKTPGRTQTLRISIARTKEFGWSTCRATDMPQCQDV